MMSSGPRLSQYGAGVTITMLRVVSSPLDTVRRGDDHQGLTREQNGAAAKESSARALLHHGHLNFDIIPSFLPLHFDAFLPWYLVFMDHSPTHDLCDVPVASAQLTTVVCISQEIAETNPNTNI